jgi:hypothetical protein
MHHHMHARANFVELVQPSLYRDLDPGSAPYSDGVTAEAVATPSSNAPRFAERRSPPSRNCSTRSAIEPFSRVDLR